MLASGKSFRVGQGSVERKPSTGTLSLLTSRHGVVHGRLNSRCQASGHLQADAGVHALVVPMAVVLHPCEADLQWRAHHGAPGAAFEGSAPHEGSMGCREVCEALGGLMASYRALGAPHLCCPNGRPFSTAWMLVPSLLSPSRWPRHITTRCGHQFTSITASTMCNSANCCVWRTACLNSGRLFDF